MRRRTNSKAYRLSFSSTRAKKFAATKKQAVADAHYWVNWGAGAVCIERKLPSGGYAQLRCIKRKVRR